MPYALIILTCLGALVLVGLWERLERDRAHRALPIRIHINGSRGKSATTRLIWGALAEAGIPAVAKTTGTAARLLLPDGTERPIRRLAPASIREQLWLLRQARRAGARAVVAECMAIQPELQAVSERRMLAATIGVITNVRTDHTDVMGPTPDDIAASLANTTPRGGVLVVGEPRFLPLYEARASQLGTRVVAPAGVATPDGRPGTTSAVSGPAALPASWRDHNRAVALAVTRELGIPDEIALKGMARSRPDPGEVATGTIELGGRAVTFIDATAANDPESLDLLMAGLGADRSPAAAGVGPGGWDLEGMAVLYNHRADRPERLRTFAAASPFVRNAAHVVVTGDRPSLPVLRALRAARGRRGVTFAAPHALSREVGRLAGAAPAVRAILFCGNSKGLDLRSTFAAELRRAEPACPASPDAGSTCG